MVKLIKKIILHPVIARIVYDVCVSFCTLFLISLCFSFFHEDGIDFLVMIGYSASIIFFSFLFGVYGRFKMSSTTVKALALAGAVFVTTIIMIIFMLFSLPLLIGSLAILALLILPRTFLNLHTVYTKNSDLNAIVHDNSPVLVVGGGGYIGTHVVEQLLRENYKVRVFDKFIYSKDVFKGMKNQKNLEIIEGDISDLYSLTVALQNVQAVIHLAGIVGDPASALDEKFTRHVNTISTRLLKEAVKAFHIPRFIFASSCSVYGETDKKVNESSPLNPVSLYARTKIDSEVELMSDTFRFFHPTILRFATVFGHSRKPRFDLVGNLFIAQAFAHKKITVFNGKQWRPFIHVSDVARAIILVLQSPIDKVSHQVFNVGDDRLNITIDGLAQKIKETLKDESKIKVEKIVKTSDKRNYRVSFKKIHGELHFSAHMTFEDGIREIFHHFKKGTYDKPYTDPYYSNLEMTKISKKEFHTKAFREKHVTMITD